MSTVNIKSDVNVDGAIMQNITVKYGTNVNVFNQCNDTGWLEVPGSPWFKSKSLGPGGLNDFNANSGGYCKFRLYSGIVFLSIANFESVNIPIWKEGSYVDGIKLGTMPEFLRPDHSCRWIVDPVDSSGYEIQLGVETTGDIIAVCLGGSKVKNVMRFDGCYPLSASSPYDKIRVILESTYA